MEIKKATLVTLLKSMAASRAHRQRDLNIFDRDSDLFQSYLEQRRTPRGSEYPFLGPIFRAEVSITTPSPHKFDGGASPYKPSTPSPQIDNSLETESKNKNNAIKAIPSSHDGSEQHNEKPVEGENSKKKITPLTGNQVQHLNANDQYLGPEENANLDIQNIDIHIDDVPYTPSTSQSPVQTESNEGKGFPSFVNQFYKDRYKPTYHKPIFSSYTAIPTKTYTTTPRALYSTTRRPTIVTTTILTTSKPTQKYYMNLVTDQPYQPTGVPAKKPSYKDATAGTSSLNGGVQYSPSYSTYHGPNLRGEKLPSLSGSSHQLHHNQNYQNPTVVYEHPDTNAHKPSTVNKEIQSPASSSYSSFNKPALSNFPSSLSNIKYEPFGEEPKFYYKPKIPDSQPKEIVHYNTSPQLSHHSPSFSKPSFSSNFDEPPSHGVSSSSNYHPSLPSHSQVENTTPHPLIYGFKPVSFQKTQPHSRPSPNLSQSHYHSLPPPSFASPAPVRTTFPVSGETFHKNLNNHHRPYHHHTTVGKPIRFPYDKRHYYLGRFVSAI